MTGQALGEPADSLLESLVDLVNLIILPGKVPTRIRPTVYGANLTALSKPDGGVRPIAIGLTLRRLAAKVAIGKVKSKFPELFHPHQLGVALPKGAEIGVHSLRQ